MRVLEPCAQIVSLQYIYPTQSSNTFVLPGHHSRITHVHICIISSQNYNLLPQLQVRPPRSLFQRKLQQMLQF